MKRWIAAALGATACAIGIWVWSIHPLTDPSAVNDANDAAGLEVTARSVATRESAATAGRRTRSLPVKTVSVARESPAPAMCTGDTCSLKKCSTCATMDHDHSQDNPAAEGWQSEVVHDHVKYQLKKIAGFLASSDAVASEVDAITTINFRTATLRPQRVTPVQKSTGLQVLRASDAGPVSRKSANQRLSQSLTELRSLFPAAAEVRTAFKVFRIEDNDDHIHTQAYVEICGGTGSDRRQINATWTCDWTTDTKPLLQRMTFDDYEEITAASGPLFSDCTASVLQHNDSYQKQLRYGIDHWCGQIDQRFGLQQNAYHGLAVADVNGDGRDDVYICQPGGLPNRLYVQDEDGTATDTSANAGVDFIRATRGAIFVDLDNDGDQDLVLTMVRSVILMENNGQGTFAWRQELETDSMLFSVVAADYDNDSAVDLFVCGRGRINSGNALPIPYYDAKNGGANLLFRNTGEFQFADVTEQTGLNVENSRYSQAAAWEDFDNDGDQDLYVANDFGRNNLYRNDDGHFVDVGAEAGVEDLGPGMSVSWGDFNQDGWPDLYVANMFSSAGGRIAFQSRFKTEEQQDTRSALQRHARGNSLFQNLGNGTFRDVSQQADVMMGRWAWSSVFADINNDGLEDVLVANGMVTETRTHDL